jgi:hypothetical protein
MSLDNEFLCSNTSQYWKPQSLPQARKRAVLPTWGLGIVLTAWMMVGCATPHATLQFTAPANVTAGTRFTVTVTVLDQGKIDAVINSPIHFTSSDPAAALPGNYYFTASDAGSHTFTNAFALATPGGQTISGYIYFDSKMIKSGINGTATITVSP